MNNGDTKVIEQLIIMFPALAAWIIVALLGGIAAGVGLLSRKFLQRLDIQDATLVQIKDLLASEIKQLREMHHDIDKRVVRLESLQGASDIKWGRRSNDHGDSNNGR